MLGTVVVGVIFTDIKGFPTDRYLPTGRNVGRVEYVQGGVSRNIAQNIAVSGMPVTFVSMTEASGLGKEAVERLDACGVNTEFVLSTPKNGIGKWMVILDENGDVAGQISCPPDMKPLAEFVTAYGNAFVREADQIILEIDIGEETSETVLSLAERYGKRVYAIVGNMSVLLKRPDLICRTDCFICNELEIGQLFGKDLSQMPVEQLARVLSQEVISHGFPSTVVTLGERGCVYYDKARDACGAVPAIPTVVVDSTGAGDAFLSGTVMGLSKGLTLEEATQIGTRLASLTLRSGESSCPKNNIPAEFLAEKAKRDAKQAAICG